MLLDYRCLGHELRREGVSGDGGDKDDGRPRTVRDDKCVAGQIIIHH